MVVTVSVDFLADMRVLFLDIAVGAQIVALISWDEDFRVLALFVTYVEHWSFADSSSI